MKKAKRTGTALLALTGLLAGFGGTGGLWPPGRYRSRPRYQLFIAASLNTVMTDLIRQYQEDHPETAFAVNADSSGTLLTQIEEDMSAIFSFPRPRSRWTSWRRAGLMVEGTRANVVNNQVVVVTLKDSGTAVTGAGNLQEAESIALAGGSVPCGPLIPEWR